MPTVLVLNTSDSMGRPTSESLEEGSGDLVHCHELAQRGTDMVMFTR